MMGYSCSSEGEACHDRQRLLECSGVHMSVKTCRGTLGCSRSSSGVLHNGGKRERGFGLAATQDNSLPEAEFPFIVCVCVCACTQDKRRNGWAAREMLFTSRRCPASLLPEPSSPRCGRVLPLLPNHPCSASTRLPVQ